ncbi:MAG: methylated-DNA--[protein]-cysteine S-methyltransferase [Anaerolineales bacterium]
MKLIFIGNIEETPLGDIWVAVSEHGLLALEFPSTQDAFSTVLAKRYVAQVVFSPEQTAEAAHQLRDYIAGRLKQFTLPIDWSTLKEFQRKVLQLTCQIPYGEVRTYKELALQLGNPRAARAVGRAQATNPMPIVIPCHRVVGSDHKLHGYGAGSGIPTKEWLLRMEKAIIP